MSADRFSLLIIGGYGTFGGRLARLLGDQPRLRLLVAGRSLEKADDFVADLRTPKDGAEGLGSNNLGAMVQAVAFDRDGDLTEQLTRLRPDLVVDASGPFQTFGKDAYKVVEACIGLDIDYADIADSTGFVAGIGGLDAAARAKGTFALSGLSSLPALSFAALDAMAPHFSRIDSVAAGIAPSAHVRIGLNVIKAIATYAGKKVTVLREGRLAAGRGLIDAMRVTVAPPGVAPLRSRKFLLVDAPDLALLPARAAGLQSSFTGVGTEPQPLQHLLSLAARLVRLRLLPSLLPFARLLQGASHRFAIGEHRGGMFVRVGGLDHAGKQLTSGWHLIAEGDDGPFIPIIGVDALVRRLLTGVRPEKGARPAAGELRLEDFEAAFRRFQITSGIRMENEAAPLPLYHRILGSAFERLPPAISALHAGGARVASGRARIERGGGLLARVVARVIGFPEAGWEAPVTVRFATEGDREIWTRDFGGTVFRSFQVEGKGRDRHLLTEVFGPFRVLLALVPEGEKLRLVVRGWRFCGIPLPLFLAPGGDTYEEERDGRFHFHVEIGGRLTGLVVRYTGWLVVEE
ncbi:SDR family oxidoreductase [Rhizobium leguminosarum]